MLSGTKEYISIYDRTQPILIYKSETICYNILNVCAEQLGNAFLRLGQPVEYFDIENHKLNDIVQYIGKRYKAIIGIQTYLFDVTLKDNVTYVHNLINAPKYNFILDHPIWLKNHLQHSLNDFTILTHDSNYAHFAEKKYGIQAKFFPLGGMYPVNPPKEKEYTLSFIGTYGTYWQEVLLIHQMERHKRFLANRYLLKLRKNPNLICHSSVSPEESMQIWQKSKMSLNIMSWHKGGFTERMANILLCKSVLVTDDTSYLDTHFEDGKDILIFNLSNIEHLPQKLAFYLQQPQILDKIAANGYENAVQNHTWDTRAKHFLNEIL